MIKLANGKEVTLDEFLTWSYQKQQQNIKPNQLGRVAWNKGQTKETNLSIAKQALAITGQRRGPAWNKGKQTPKEVCDKIGAAHKGLKYNTTTYKKRTDGKPRNCKKMMTPNGLYPTLKAVVEASCQSAYIIRSWMKKWPEHYYYVN